MLTFLPEWRGLPPELVRPRVPHRNIQDPENPTRLRGDKTGLIMPERAYLPWTAQFPDPSRVDAHYLQSEEFFYYWCNTQDVWTLSFNKSTWNAVLQLNEEYGPVWEDLKREIFPSQANELLHRKHGFQSVYTTAGCRGPLCKLANRETQRGHTDNNPDPSMVELDQHLDAVRNSFMHYLQYVKYVRLWRIVNTPKKREDGLEWRKVSFRDSILMDCTTV